LPNLDADTQNPLSRCPAEIVGLEKDIGGGADLCEKTDGFGQE
jgi:hypothetical protein